MKSASTPDIASWYTAILLREPDAIGANFWEAELSSGRQSSGDAITSFLESPEYASNVLPIMTLYQAVLNRIPDLEGLQFWSSELASGYNLKSVVKAFANSPESNDLLEDNDTSNSDFIISLYQTILGREPDAGGLVYWSSSGLSKAELLSHFVESSEAVERFTPSSHIISAYLAIEGRFPTPVELQEAINAGDLIQMIDSLLADLVGSEAEQPSSDADAGEGV
jgi:hypothetical protein